MEWSECESGLRGNKSITLTISSVIRSFIKLQRDTDASTSLPTNTQFPSYQPHSSKYFIIRLQAGDGAAAANATFWHQGRDTCSCVCESLCRPCSWAADRRRHAECLLQASNCTSVIPAAPVLPSVQATPVTRTRLSRAESYQISKTLFGDE